MAVVLAKLPPHYFLIIRSQSEEGGMILGREQGNTIL